MNTKKAQNLVEYALIFALVTLIAITVLSYITKQVDSVFEDNNTKTPVQVQTLDK